MGIGSTLIEINIKPFCLPPHITHALQPLDVAVFKSLKDCFAKFISALSFTKKNFVVTKREFSHVVKRPLDQAFCITNIKAGFTKCGKYPFKPDDVAKHKIIPSSVHGVGSSASDSNTDSSNSQSSCPSSSVVSNEISSSEICRRLCSLVVTSGQCCQFCYFISSSDSTRSYIA